MEVEEVKRPFAGDLGVFSKPEVSGWSFGGEHHGYALMSLFVLIIKVLQYLVKLS